ncbi:hypothetical protein FHX50_001872 [Helcobacillus massiliensis]|uniref:Uncharacterized protein n=1 Tax=Helcobacillus massiliensis TaxID=521392 RepID=A0A839QV21_9MICO|nr:hypothetical protein [Helcobacillus massiliensis]
MLDPRAADCPPLFEFAPQPQGGPFFESDGISAAFTAGNGDDSGLLSVVFVPLTEGGESPCFIIWVGPDIENVEVNCGIPSWGEGSFGRSQKTRVKSNTGSRE